MTDKEQIIIDGCNVSKCRFYEEGLCKALDAFKQTEYDFVFCNEYKNCHLKQLVRKTQELESLKSERFTREELISIQEKDIDRYCKALKEIEEYCDKQISLTGDLPFRTTESDILDIINKAKGE